MRLNSIVYCTVAMVIEIFSKCLVRDDLHLHIHRRDGLFFSALSFREMMKIQSSFRDEKLVCRSAGQFSRAGRDENEKKTEKKLSCGGEILEENSLFRI